MHLKEHIKGQDNTTKEIINHVPSTSNSELIFDKTINLSVSSCNAMNVEKVSVFIIFFYFLILWF